MTNRSYCLAQGRVVGTCCGRNGRGGEGPLLSLCYQSLANDRGRREVKGPEPSGTSLAGRGGHPQGPDGLQK